MKLSKKSDTAIQVLLYLRNNNYKYSNYYSTHQISKDLNVSYSNIRKILIKLNDLGIIDSKLGQSGGVSLAENYNTISIKTLLLNFEDVAIGQSKFNCEQCSITPSCRFLKQLALANENFFNTFEHIYLDNL